MHQETNGPVGAHEVRVRTQGLLKLIAATAVTALVFALASTFAWRADAQPAAPTGPVSPAARAAADAGMKPAPAAASRDGDAGVQATADGGVLGASEAPDGGALAEPAAPPTSGAGGEGQNARGAPASPLRAQPPAGPPARAVAIRWPARELFSRDDGEPGEEDDADLVFEPGVQTFHRAELRANPDLDASDGRHDWQMLQRIRLQLLATYLDHFRAFAQMQDVRAWGAETSTTSNEANTDLHQGYFEWFSGKPSDERWAYARVGRQEVNWGSLRMIANLDWNPVARSFDAARVHLKHGIYELDAIGAIVARQQNFEISDPATTPPTVTRYRSTGSQFMAAMLKANVRKEALLEGMVLGMRERATPLTPTANRNVADFGGRAHGEFDFGLDYEVEAHVQTGTTTGRDHFAWAHAEMLGYTFKKIQTTPRATLRFAQASGEACIGHQSQGCGTSKSREFYNFFPLNHAYYGLVDLFGWRNMRDFELGASFFPMKPLKATLGYHFFQLQEPTGRWSNAGGQNVGIGWDAQNRERSLGHEIDFVLNAKVSQVVNLQPGYGIFIPTGAGTRIGGKDPQHFAYLWLTTHFD